MTVDKISILDYLRDIKAELKNDGIVELGLFGSYARNEAGVYSDIDVAIRKSSDYLDKRTAYDYFDEVSKIKSLIRKKFHRNTDIFDLDSNSSMNEEIKKDLIYV